jgi:hypothetical protein
MLPAELSEHCSDIGFQTKTDSGTILVYFNAEELVRWVEIRDFGHLLGFCFYFDCSFGGSLLI